MGWQQQQHQNPSTKQWQEKWHWLNQTQNTADDINSGTGIVVWENLGFVSSLYCYCYEKSICITCFHWLKKEAWPITNPNPKMLNISRHSNTGEWLVHSDYWKPQLHLVTHINHTSNTSRNTSFGIYSSKDLRHENNWNNVLQKTLTPTQRCWRKKKSCNSVAWSRLFVKGKKQEVIREDTFHALNSFLYLSFMGLWIAEIPWQQRCLTATRAWHLVLWSIQKICL